MYSSVEKDLISRVTRLRHGEIKVDEFFNEIINFFVDNLDAIWNELSPLVKAMQIKDKRRPRNAPAARSQVEKVKAITRLSVPERLTSCLHGEWVRNPLDFWERCIDVNSQQTNKIHLLYTRITTSTDDTNLYRMFAAVATYHGAVRYANLQRYERYSQGRFEEFMTGLVQNVIREEQIDEDERCRIRNLFETLYHAGSRWCKWGELIGGFGGFFAHPSCLARTMIEKNLANNDLKEIAGHLREIGMDRYTAEYNEVADRILESVEVHLDCPLPTQKRPSPNADEGITAHSIPPGICEPRSRRKRAKKDGTAILAQAKGNRTKPQIVPDSQSFGASMEKSFDTDPPHVASTKAAQNIRQSSASGEIPEPTSWIGHSNLTPSAIEQPGSFEHAPSPLNISYDFEQAFNQSPPITDLFIFPQSFNQDTAMDNSDDFRQPFNQDPFATVPYNFPQPFSHNPSIPPNFAWPFDSCHAMKGLLRTANETSAIPTEY